MKSSSFFWDMQGKKSRKGQCVEYSPPAPRNRPGWSLGTPRWPLPCLGEGAKPGAGSSRQLKPGRGRPSRGCLQGFPNLRQATSSLLVSTPNSQLLKYIQSLLSWTATYLVSIAVKDPCPTCDTRRRMIEIEDCDSRRMFLSRQAHG